MKRSTALSMAAAALVCTAAPYASAQDIDTMINAPVAAPRNAFEFGVNAGYNQGFGNIQRGRPVGNLADAGLTIGGAVGYRFTPTVGVALTANYSAFTPDLRLSTGTSLHGLTLGAEASAHFKPHARIDPYITAGAGYRMLWIAPAGLENNTLIHGFQLAKVTAGVDVRVTPDISVGPFVGADLNLYMWQDPEAGPAAALANKSVSTYVYAGVQGKFDVGGERLRETPVTTGKWSY